MKGIGMFRLFFFIMLMCGVSLSANAAPCYGTDMPGARKLTTGIQSYSILDRDLEGDSGSVRSTQSFLILSYGVYDWLAIDLKGGAGNIKQHPPTSDELDYRSSFAGGYGLRILVYDSKAIKAVFGFQHISVHPSSTDIGDTKHRAILDDWQASFLVSRGFNKCTPYAGIRLSRVDYIHWNNGQRKRVMSDLTENIGLILGTDFLLSDKIRINLEGEFFDTEAFSLGIDYRF